MDSFAIALLRQSTFKRDNRLFANDLQTYDQRSLKTDLQKKPLNEQLNASAELLNRLYDQMNPMAHTAKVRFIAERIEHQHHQVLARSLPFDFFQGDYDSLPKALTHKGYTSP